MATVEKQNIDDFNKYELAQMVGVRALQISMGAPFAIDFSPEELAALNFNPIAIAKKELEADAIPLKVLRKQALPPTLLEE